MLIRSLPLAVALMCFAWPAMSGTVYGVKSLSPGGTEVSTAPAVLFSFLDTGGPGVSIIGSVTRDSTQIDVDGLALSRTHGQLGFEMTGTDAGPTSRLVSINTSSAVATSIGSAMTGRAMRGAMFDRQNRLWVVDSASNSLLRIDPTTGAVLSETPITVGGLPRDIAPGTDLAQREDGTVVLTTYRFEQTDFDGPTFYTLDLDTGAATLAFVDTTPDPFFPSIPVYNSGLAAGGDQNPNVLFTLDGDASDDLFQYGLPSYLRTVVAANFYPAFNAGGGDLASLAPLEVAEPISASMLAVGLLGLCGLRRRR